VEQFSDRVCLSVTGSLAGFGIVEALRTARRLGFQSAAIMPSGTPRHSLGKPLPTLQWDRADEETRQSLLSELKAFRRISIHQAWDDRWRFWIDVATELGAEIATVHAGLPGPASTEAIAARARQILEWGRYATDRGVVIGVENEGGRESDFLALVESLDAENVGVTLDIGHCAYFSEAPCGLPENERGILLNARIQALVRRLGTRLKLLHVHNVKPFAEVDFSRIPEPYWRPGMLVDHRRLDDGLIDIPELVELLREMGYEGMFEIELEEPEIEPAARAAGEYLHRLLSP